MGVAEEQAHFQTTVPTLQGISDWAENTYDRLAKRLRPAWDSRPILTMFSLIFVAMSFVPVALFLTFSLFVSATFIIIGLGTAIVATIAVVAFAGTLLICLLIFLIFVALALTVFATSTLLAYELLTDVRSSGVRDGTSQWFQDRRKQLRSTPQPRPDQQTNNEDTPSVGFPLPEKAGAGSF
ncbi:hypothetical protein BDW22DRAFT_196081 [Trametopsis cervina]|nr:hypothetical protein BDW22DRAFT_196081 [Trametopsis cervina]